MNVTEKHRQTNEETSEKLINNCSTSKKKRFKFNKLTIIKQPTVVLLRALKIDTKQVTV